jgi:hypothetical protein
MEKHPYQIINTSIKQEDTTIVGDWILKTLPMEHFGVAVSSCTIKIQVDSHDHCYRTWCLAHLWEEEHWEWHLRKFPMYRVTTFAILINKTIIV